MGTGTEGIAVGQSLSEYVLDSNFRVLREALDRLNTRWISGSDMEGGATRTFFVDRYGTWALADAVDTGRCAGQTHIPAWWGAGTVAITGYFSSGTASTNPFRISMSASGVAPGAALDVSDISETVDIAGPAIANGLVEHTFATQLALVAADRIAHVRLLRLGAHANDTHAASIQVLGALLTFTPL